MLGAPSLVLGLLWEVLSPEVGSGSLIPVLALTWRRIQHTSASSSRGISWRQKLQCSGLLPWHLLSGTAALSLSSCLPSLPSNSSWKLFFFYFLFLSLGDFVGGETHRDREVRGGSGFFLPFLAGLFGFSLEGCSDSRTLGMGSKMGRAVPSLWASRASAGLGHFQGIIPSQYPIQPSGSLKYLCFSLCL